MLVNEDRMAPLTDEEAEERLRSMEAIIDNEADIKVASLRRREGDLPRQKALHVRRGIEAISVHYKKLEKKVENHTKISVLRMRNNERLKVLTSMDAMVANVLEGVRRRIRNLTWDNVNLHRKVFSRLILQGLLKMTEANVLLVVKPSDAKVASNLMPMVMEDFHAYLLERIPPESCGSYSARLAEPLETVHVVMDGDLGGVVLVSECGTIIVDNTLGKRLQMMAHELVPQLKHILFKAALRPSEVPAFDPKIKKSSVDLHRRTSSKSLFRYSFISYPPNGSQE